MITVERAKELLGLFNQYVETGHSLDDASLQQRFIPHGWKQDLVVSDSFLGRLFRVLYFKRDPSDQVKRIHQVFSQVLEVLSNNVEKAEVSQASLLRLHQFVKIERWSPNLVKHEVSSLPEMSSLQELQAAAEAKQDAEMNAQSLLHTVPKSGRTVKLGFFRQIFCEPYAATKELVDGFQEFIKRMGYADARMEETQRLIEAGEKQMRQMQERFFSNAESPQFYQALATTSKEMAETIQTLSAGGKWVYCGSYGTPGAPLQLLGKLWQKFDPQSAKTLPPEMAALLSGKGLPNPGQFIDKFLSELDLIKKTIPGFAKLFQTGPMSTLLADESRHLPKGLSQWLPGFMAQNLESWQKQGLLGNIMEFVEDGEFRQFVLEKSEQAFSYKDPEQVKLVYDQLKQKVSDLSKTRLESLQNGILETFNMKAQELLFLLQKRCPLPLQEMLGIDFLSMQGQLWIEFQRQENGNFTVLVHDSGGALNLRSAGEKVEWPLKLTDVKPERLNNDFFKFLLFHKLAPDYKPATKLPVESLYSGMLGYLKGTLDQEHASMRLFEKGVLSPWQMNQALWTKSEIPLERIRYEWHREALLDFCQAHMPDPEHKLTLDSEEDCSALETALNIFLDDVNTLQPPLDESALRQVRATQEEIHLALKEAREKFRVQPEDPSKPTIHLPVQMSEQIQKILHQAELSSTQLKTVKDILLWGLGDDASPLIEALLPDTIISTSATPELSTKGVAKTKYPKGWLGTLLFSAYFKIATQAFQYVLLLTRAYHVGLALILRPYVVKALKAVIPSFLQEWYVSIMTALQHKMMEMVVHWALRMITHSSKEEVSRLQGLLQTLRGNAKELTHTLLGIQEMDYGLVAPIPAPKEEAKPFALDNLDSVNSDCHVYGMQKYDMQLVEDLSATSSFDPDKIQGTLTKWVEELQKRSSADRTKIFQIQDLIFKLPIPQVGVQDVWDLLPEDQIETCLNTLTDITDQLEQTTHLRPKEDFTTGRSHSTILMYGLLAIMDKLARRDPQAGLSGYKLNAYPLLEWYRSEGAEIEDPRYLDKLHKVSAYLMPEIDLENLPQPQEIQARAENALFNYYSKYDKVSVKEGGELSFRASFIENSVIPEFAYLRDRLTDPAVHKSLASRGVPETACHSHKILALFRESLNFQPNSSLSPVYKLLRLQTLCCNKLAKGGCSSSEIDKLKAAKSPNWNYNQPGFFKKLITNLFDLWNVPIPKGFDNLTFKPDLYEISYSSDEISSLLFNYVRDQADIIAHPNQEKDPLLEMIRCQTTDELIRALGYLKQNPDQFINIQAIKLMEHFFFRAGHLYKQLKSSPKVAASLGEVVTETLKYLELGDCQPAYKQFLFLGMRLKKYCASYVSAEHLTSFPDFRKLLQKKIDEAQTPQDESDYRKLYALSFDAPIESYSTDQVHAMKVALVQALIALKPEVEEDSAITQAFEAMYSARGRSIITQVDNDPAFKEELIAVVLKQKGKSAEDGEYEFFLGSGGFYSKKFNEADLLDNLKRKLKKLGEETSPLIYKGSGSFKTDDLTLEFMIAKYSQNIAYVSCVKKINGVPHEMVDGTKMQSLLPAELQSAKKDAKPLVFWLSRQKDSAGASPLHIYRNGKSLRTLQVKQEESGQYTLVKDNTPSLQPINSALMGQALQPLARFCPLSNIEGYGYPGETSLRKIRFEPYDLSFNVVTDPVSKKVKAENADLFPGYTIASKQIHPETASIPSYLLLENAQGQKKILVPAGQWIPTFAASALAHLGSLANLIYPELLKLLPAPAGSKFYVYDLEEGQLATKDHEAAAYLLNLYLLSGNQEKVKTACSNLEMLCKQKPITKETNKQLWALAGITLVFPWSASIRQRILAVIEENQLLQVCENTQAPKKKKGAKGAPKDRRSVPANEDALWAAMTYLDLIVLHSDKERRKQLTDDQEWFLFQKYFRHTENLYNYFKQFDDDFGAQALVSAIDYFGWENAILSILPESAQQRYELLSKKYGSTLSPVSQMGFFSKHLMNQIASPLFTALPAALGLQEDQNQNLSSLLDKATALIKVGSYWKNVDQNARHIKKQPLFEGMQQTMEKDPPLTCDWLNAESVRTYFLTYYAIARSEKAGTMLPLEQDPHCSLEDSRNQVKAAQSQLTDTLCLIRSGIGKTWNPEDQMLVECLYAICTRPTVFESSSKLLEALKQPPQGEVIRKKRPEDPSKPADSSFLSKLGLTKQDDYITKFEPYMDFWDRQPLFEKFIDQLVKTSFMSQTGQPLSLLAKKRETREGSGKARTETQIIPERGIQIAPRVDAFKELEKEDQQFDEMFDQLFNTALEVASDAAPESGHFPLYQEEGANGLLLEQVRQTNSSLKAYYDRPGRVPTYLRLKQPKVLWGLYLDLVKMRDQWKSELAKEQREMLALVNTRRADHRVTWDDLSHFFLTGDSEKTGITTLSQAAMPRLDMLIGRYLVRDTRFKQMQRTVEQLERVFKLDPVSQKAAYEEGIEQVATLLKTRRTYRFSDLPQPTPRDDRLMRTMLMFEYASNTLLWEKQSSRIKEVLMGDQRDLVFELIMSAGKTSTIIPIISRCLADGKQLLFNIWPSQIVEPNTSQISRQNKKFFDQTMNALRFSRDLPMTLKNLKGLYALFTRAMEQGETINMTREDAQALELLLIDILYRCENEPSSDSTEGEELVFGIAKALAFMRSHGKVMGDEAHELLSDKQELNYPVGPTSTISLSIFNIIDVCMRCLSEDEGISKLIYENRLMHISPDQYEDVQKRLALRLSRYGKFQVTDGRREEFIKFISGKAQEIPVWIRESKCFTEISMVKGVLTALLPMILSRTVAVDYGPSLNGKDEFANPYEANSSPIDRATIRNPHEALVKTYVMFFTSGLTAEQTGKLIATMNQQAIEEMRKGHIALQDTEAYKTLASWFPPNSGIDLKAVLTEGKNAKDWPRVLAGVSHKGDAIRLYIREFVWKQIAYWKSNIRSNAQNFSSIFESQFYDTGTPYNHGAYPSSVGMLWDPGTAGEALHIIGKKCPQDGVHLLEKSQPSEVLDEVLQTYFAKGSDYTAVIDGGAQFRGLDNITVARRMMAYVEQHRPDIKAIDFFMKDTQGRDQLVSLVCGAKDPIPYELCKVPAEERLAYFDQRHGFAANIPQKFNGKGLLLIGEQHYLYRLLQEVFRMRGVKNFKKLFSQSAPDAASLEAENLKQTQTIHFALTPQVRQKISVGKAPVSVRDIVMFAMKNEAELVATQNYHAYCQKVHNVVRRAILDKILQAKNAKEMQAIFKASKETGFLVSKVEDDPKKLYGLIDQWVPTKKALDSLTASVLKQVAELPYFSAAERRRIKEEMDKMAQPIMPEKTHVYTDGRGLHTDLLEDLGKEVNVEQNQDVENEQETEQEMEMETLAQSQSQGWNFTEGLWSHLLDPMSDLWLKFTAPAAKVVSFFDRQLQKVGKMLQGETSGLTPPLFRIQDLLAASKDNALSKIAKLFDEQLWVSNNFIPRILKSKREAFVEIGSNQQRPLYQVLIRVIEENGKLKVSSVGCLSQSDAAHWRQLLEKERGRPPGPGKPSPVKMILYDTQLGTEVVESGADLNRLKDNPDWILMEAKLKFLNGDLRYSEKQIPLLKEWIKKSDIKQMMDAFYTIHHQREPIHQQGHRSLRGSDIDKIFKELQEELPA